MSLLWSLSDIEILGNLLRDGGIVGYPTESVYGLGCDPQNADSVAEIYRLKRRRPEQGFLLIGAEWAHIGPYIDAGRVPVEVLRRIEAGWPGPATWVFPASPAVPSWLVGRHAGVALRVTAHAPAAALCRAFGGALVSTSANPHGEPPARDARAVLGYFPTQLSAVLDEAVGTLEQPTTIRDALTGAIIRA